jgi:hypothetical protein
LAKINEIEVKKKYKETTKPKLVLYKNKIDKPLANLTKMRKEKIHINEIRNKKGEITKNNKEIIRDSFENLYSNK